LISTRDNAALQHENCAPFVVALRIPPVGYQIYPQFRIFFLSDFILQIVVLSVGAPAAQQMAIAMICHPSGASQMALERFARALRIAFGIDVKNDSCNFPPVRLASVGIEQPEIGDDVLLVIGRQHGINRCQVRNIGIKRG
jgi:hypothetical protein